jgi:hypothetical protein
MKPSYSIDEKPPFVVSVSMMTLIDELTLIITLLVMFNASNLIVNLTPDNTKVWWTIFVLNRAINNIEITVFFKNVSQENIITRKVE